MTSKKKNKEAKRRNASEDVMPAVDREYEDIPLSKSDPIMKASTDIQRAHFMGMAGIVLGFIVPFLGIILGIMGFLRVKGVADVPYDMKRRYSSSKAICKAAIAVGIVMMVAVVFILSTGVIHI